MAFRVESDLRIQIVDVEEHLSRIVEYSFSRPPEEMLAAALDACVKLSGACGGSILGEEGPALQFLFSNVSELIGVKVPMESIAGVTVTQGRILYTYAPADERHFAGVDEKLGRLTRFLLSLPIPSVHRSAGQGRAIRNAGALQLLFDEDIMPEENVEQGRREFPVDQFRTHALYGGRLRQIFWMLPSIAFAMEFIRLQQTSYQAIHELKNKLISGLSWVGCIRDDLKERNPGLVEDATILEDFELATSSLREGAELAKTYLQLTKLYAPKFEPSDLRQLLRETAASVRALGQELGAAGLRVDVETEENIPLRDVDPGQLRMALFNLCKNAVEVLVTHRTPDPTLRLRLATQGRCVRICVADNGPGMPEEIAAHLFVAFKTKKEGGTGLGLTITKKIVEIHGGEIRCRTGASGTEFVIEL